MTRTKSIGCRLTKGLRQTPDARAGWAKFNQQMGQKTAPARIHPAQKAQIPIKQWQLSLDCRSGIEDNGSVMAAIKLLYHEISNTRISGGALMFICEFHIDAPQGELPVGFTITYPTGKAEHVDGPVLIHNEAGRIGIRMPVTISAAVTGIYYVRLSVAGEELGDFPFTVDQ